LVVGVNLFQDKTREEERKRGREENDAWRKIGGERKSHRTAPSP
jgi:hypothetical protein